MKHHGHPLSGIKPQDSFSIIRPGQNAWKSAIADRLSVLIDGEAYFRTLETVLSQAEREVWIVGWDFNPEIRMRPDDATSPKVGDFLLDLVERRPELTIRVLVWAFGPIYSGKSLKMFRRKGWSAHPRIVLRFDKRHPIRASHHQKMVVVDDKVAFVGGIDLTAGRWDTPDHQADDPRRVRPNGKRYEPVHDMQVAIEGEAAQLASQIARERWLHATDDTVPAVGIESSVALDGVVADFTKIPVGFARSMPAIRGRAQVTEALDLTLAAVAAARERIYIESQYFASKAICDVLCRRLSEPDGPEVIVISTLSSHGAIERMVLGANRDRMIRRLKKCDRHGRVRAFYPVVPTARGGEQEVIVHSKLVIVDDVFLRAGSSNLNQRSVALDTELDIAFEAGDEKQKHVLGHLRDRLVAEHLGVDAELFRSTMAQTGSIARSIDLLNNGSRGLRSFPDAIGEGPTEPVFGSGIVDPVAPWWPMSNWLHGLRKLFRRQVTLLSGSASALRPSKASLASSETSPSGRGRKK